MDMSASSLPPSFPSAGGDSESILRARAAATGRRRGVCGEPGSPPRSSSPPAAEARKGAADASASFAAGGASCGSEDVGGGASSADGAPLPPPVKSASERAAIAAILPRCVLLSDLDAAAREAVIDAVRPAVYAPGATVLAQGAAGDDFFLIESGTATVLVNGVAVVTLRAGDSFGELALLYDAPRAATVLAAAAPSPPLVTWVLARRAFRATVVRGAVRRRAAYTAFLRGVPALAALTGDEVAAVADALAPLSAAAGEVLLREGDTGGDRFFIVEAGELKAEKAGAGGAAAGAGGEACPRLRRGDYFGELALLREGAPRAATVTAVTDARLLVMDRAAFLRLLGPLEDVLQRDYAKL